MKKHVGVCETHPGFDEMVEIYLAPNPYPSLYRLDKF